MLHRSVPQKRPRLRLVAVPCVCSRGQEVAGQSCCDFAGGVCERPRMSRFGFAGRVPYAPQKTTEIQSSFFCARREASMNAPSLRAAKTTSPSARCGALRLLTSGWGGGVVCLLVRNIVLHSCVIVAVTVLP